MNYLVDTHTLIWAVCSPGKLSPKIRLLLRNPDENIMVSVVSFWEISLKYSLGKLYLEGLTPEDFVEAATDTGFQIVELNAFTTSTYHQLKATHHRDPFDRMLIWQAIRQDYTLISKDKAVHLYQSEGLKVAW
jgi:PIN domain nuclease of toxin-antitoxin system